MDRTTRLRELAPLPAFIAAQLPAGVHRYAVDVDGREMAVMELGQGRPVLLLHGNPTWGFLYRKVASELSGQPLRLIMPDLIGLGFSAKPRQAAVHTLANHGRWIGELLDVLSLDDVIFVGQDWGGAIGLSAFADRRSRLTGMVVLNTAVSPPRPGFRPTAFHRFARMPVVSDLAFRGLGFPQNTMALAQGDRSSIRGAVARAYRYPLRHLRDRVAPLALARMVPDSPAHPSIPDLEICQEVFEENAGPCAIVWGQRDPILGRVLGWIEKLKPSARVTKTDAGHFLQEEVPAEIAEAICWVAAGGASSGRV